MYHIIEALSRWLAPILSFTAEDFWDHMPGQREASVFLAEWYDGLKPIADSAWDHSFWSQVIDIRDDVNKALEEKRTQGKIGAPLEAKVILYAGEQISKMLTQLKDELRFVLITSDATVLPLSRKTSEAQATAREDLFIEVKPLSYKKCQRCWHRREDVGIDADYPGICSRCVSNIKVESEGERRMYA